MSKFIAYLQQKGGCDYTIGCGNLLWEIEAANIESAKTEFKSMIAYIYHHPEWRLFSFRIFKVIEEDSIYLIEFYNELDEKKRREEIEKIEEKEKQELERLSKKYKI